MRKRNQRIADQDRWYGVDSALKEIEQDFKNLKINSGFSGWSKDKIIAMDTEKRERFKKALEEYTLREINKQKEEAEAA